MNTLTRFTTINQDIKAKDILEELETIEVPTKVICSKRNTCNVTDCYHYKPHRQDSPLCYRSYCMYSDTLQRECVDEGWRWWL